jgi:molybdate transport system substrate-binding protein
MVKNQRLVMVSLVLAIVILVSFLSGCSTEVTTTPATTVPPTTTVMTQSPTLSTTLTPAPAITINIAAASSLTDALKAINVLFVQANSNVTLTPSFASSGTLQTQIENGAPSDIFISAAATQMDNLQKKDLILTDTRKNLLNNKVVLIVPVDSSLGITNFNDLAADKVKKIAIGDPKSVPAGTYASQAFDAIGITAQITPKEILGSDARQVLNYVESGNVDAGIVYSTDALTSAKVKVVASAPAEINAKIVYPAAVIKASKNQEAAKAYLAFLFSAPAKVVFEKYGFTLVSQ